MPEATKTVSVTQSTQQPLTPPVQKPTVALTPPTQPKTMTTADARPAVVTDLPLEPSLVAEEGIVARPLTNPDFTEQVKLKNPGLAMRWVNRVAASGGRAEQMRFSGFRNAVPGTDVEAPPYMKRDNAIIYGDLILMVIDRKLLEGALLYNRQRATERVRRTDVTEKSKSTLRNEIAAQGGASSELQRKLQMFAPGAADDKSVSRLIDQSE